ncbi:MAG: AAA family ATPase [Burkholderiales bacterium]|nr:AAA family ATPase [Burkholderiales bacterium]
MGPLIDALRDPAAYAHPAGRVEVIETHISWVLLAGEFAYKLKKPVRLPFLDFSTLAARRHFCEEELRLNRRTAPGLYLDVLPVVRTGAGGARIGASGEPVDYAVKMRRFADEALADAMARRGALGAAEIDELAAVLARFHAAAPGADLASVYGMPEAIEAPALGNFDQIEAPDPASAVRLAALRAWTLREGARLRPVFTARREQGCVRECHGDLHLGNIAFLAGRAVPFDCIEFDPQLRCIDVMSETAFLVMDLLAHRLPRLAWRLLNAWLEATGDYEGVGVLRYYLVYRALVRAKIARIRGADGDFRGLLALAEALARERRPALVLMQGLSGSGKSVLAQSLLERLGAVRLRSDVERKRLHGLDARSRTGAEFGAGIYDAAAGERTYARLAALAAGVLEAGYPAVVDAAFLEQEQRTRLLREAQRRRVPCAIARCTASAATLRRRVGAREQRGEDASDAGIAVLERQLARARPLAPEEQALAITVDTDTPAGAQRGLEAIAARLAQTGEGEAYAAH